MNCGHNWPKDPGATTGITSAVYVCPNGLSEGAGLTYDVEDHRHGFVEVTGAAEGIPAFIASSDLAERAWSDSAIRRFWGGFVDRL